MAGQRLGPLPLYLAPSSLDICRGQSLPHDTDPFVRLSLSPCCKAVLKNRRTQLFGNTACLLMEEVPAALLQLSDFRTGGGWFDVERRTRGQRCVITFRPPAIPVARRYYRRVRQACLRRRSGRGPSRTGAQRSSARW